MQYLTITKDMTLWQLINIVGERNIDAVLNANGLERAYNIGEKFYARNAAIKNTGITVDYQKKLSILNQFVGDSDLYEKAAVSAEDDWVLLASYNCFPDAIKIPDGIELPNSIGVWGNNIAVNDVIYQQCVMSLLRSEGDEPHTIDQSVFSEYSASYYSGMFMESDVEDGRINAYQWFKLPWKEVFLYSSLSDEVLYFPVYPKGFGDGTSANYDDMPEMLYQYEPWKVYKSSGPREIKFTFEHIHRDMWNGDHRDGMANQLIRGCEANCYPEYNGSLVNYSLVSMYINGENLITGVMTDCNVEWSGPIGLDGFYLVFDLSFTIVEVSPEPLDFTAVRNKGLIQ